MDIVIAEQEDYLFNIPGWDHDLRREVHERILLLYNIKDMIDDSKSQVRLVVEAYNRGYEAKEKGY